MIGGKRTVGVLGVGFGSQVHVPAFQSEGWEVLAIYSRDERRARKAASAAGVNSVYTDADQLIERSDLDAVAIATPPATHRDLVISALRAGKHVLCEKPFALDASQAAEMHVAAQKSGLTAMVAHEFRHAPQRACIRELLRQGYVGDFYLCAIELLVGRPNQPAAPPLPWIAKRSEGGGFLGALGSHYIDGLRSWFGEVHTVTGGVKRLRPDLIDPKTGELNKSDTDDSFWFALTFTNGGIATVTATTSANPSRGARITVIGSSGTLYAEQPGQNPHEDGVVFGSRDGEPLRALNHPSNIVSLSDPRDSRLAAFRLLIRDFNGGIRDGTSPSPNF